MSVLIYEQSLLPMDVPVQGKTPYLSIEKWKPCALNTCFVTITCYRAACNDNDIKFGMVLLWGALFKINV